MWPIASLMATTPEVSPKVAFKRQLLREKSWPSGCNSARWRHSIQANRIAHAVCARRSTWYARPSIAFRYIQAHFPGMEITSCHGVVVVLNRDGAGEWKFRESVRASAPHDDHRDTLVDRDLTSNATLQCHKSIIFPTITRMT